MTIGGYGSGGLFERRQGYVIAIVVVVGMRGTHHDDCWRLNRQWGEKARTRGNLLLEYQPT